MITQYIQLKNVDWNILVYYNVDIYDFAEVSDSLRQISCSKSDMKKAFKVLHKKNTGFTFSNDHYKMSIVCVGKATDVGQFIDTVIHEAKHVQSHICEYYNIEEDGEDAAYLIGHLVHKMYGMLERMLRMYV